MFNYTQRPKWNKKAELLGEKPIRFDIWHCNTVFPSELASAQLVSNEVFEINIIMNGNGICQVFGQSIPCRQGDIFVIPPDLPHNCFVHDSMEDLQIYRIYFDIQDWFSEDVIDIGSPNYCHGAFSDGSIIACATLNAKAYDSIMAICESISRETLYLKKDWQSVVRSYFTIFFITLARYIGESEHTTFEYFKEWHLAGVAVRMVMDNYRNNNLRCGTLADALHVSTSHFCRMFKSFTGESFSDFLRSTRLNHACKLLRETKMTVEQIVEECGMKDIQSFYHNFQKYVGTTPHQYRIDKQNTKGDKIMVILSDISEKLQQGRAKAVAELVQQALDEGCDPVKILNEGLLCGMDVIGQKFRDNEIFIPDVLVAARAMNMGTQILKPHLVANGVEPIGKACIGTVQGDLHDIGKNLVKMMLEGKAIEVIDLGTDVPAEKFVQTAIEENCDVICCSALLTTTMDVMADVIKAAENAGIRDKVKILIGGAPVNEEFSARIGADCYTVDAASAATAAAAFCKAKHNKN